MVFIGICSVLQLSSLICMVFVTFGVWIPQARDILNTRDDENGHGMSWKFKGVGTWKKIGTDRL